MFDGDTISTNSVISDEANSEDDAYIGSLRFMVKVNGELNVDFTSLTKLTYYNLTRDPE